MRYKVQTENSNGIRFYVVWDTFKDCVEGVFDVEEEAAAFCNSLNYL